MYSCSPGQPVVVAVAAVAEVVAAAAAELTLAVDFEEPLDYMVLATRVPCNAVP